MTSRTIRWAKDWFRKELVGIEAEGVRIDSVKDVEGDCEVGMRKSKLVTIYDQKITMLWRAEEGDESVTGSLIAHEVAHDMDEDDYVFTSTLDSAATKKADAYNTIARKALANKLRPIFQRFPAELIETHGKDLLSDVDGGSGAGSGASTPATPSSAGAANQSKPTVPSGSSVSVGTAKRRKSFNTAVVKAEGEFMCDASTLWEFLTNEQKIPLWSRNPAKFRPEVGAEVELFGRNIIGKVEDVKAPKSITTSWRAPTWTEGYFGTLETTLHQGSASTTLTLRLSGVPVGKEDEAERNLTSYYINSLKQIGSVFESLSFSPLPSPTSTTPSATPKALTPSQARARARARAGVHKPSLWVMVGNVSVVFVSVGIVAALAAGIYYGPSGPGGRKA
ncbi:BQ2448_2559 [Microbotryum intermedium]|uniref:BQ2448_2559 protein n=1 Tax=Microbotryum intermedium TaxID=269621 RepID=A0A238F9W2_9BASI|nr:BQ2448_2559 [Microbotryum intermedium]